MVTEAESYERVYKEGGSGFQPEPQQAMRNNTITTLQPRYLERIQYAVFLTALNCDP